MAAIRVRGAQATTLEEAAKMYIDYTYPRDDPSQDSAEDGMVRRTTLYPPGTDLCPPWDIWNLRLAVDRQRIERAPGLDSIDAGILKNSAPYIEEELLDIFNECLDKGYFPNKWRIADLRLLYKGGGKDKETPKSYRPICLLPVASKVLEHMIVQSLRPILSAASHPRQFGSTRGKGTTDALLRLLAYADDIDIIGRSFQAASDAFLALVGPTRRLGLEVNSEKTKYMVTRKVPRLGEEVTFGEYQFEKTNVFVYLGSLVTQENEPEQENRHRIIVENQCYFSIPRQFWTGAVSRKSKLCLYKTTVHPVLLYGCENWSTTRACEQELLVFEKRILRRLYCGVLIGGEWKRRKTRSCALCLRSLI
ncbi:uncharacterized protein [Halyomorpha halys]|uniref:uncharacterized protein n=1 Tax=Halyomorpha halys TaxID=286706 RepID=UPI0034D37B19